MVQPFGLNALTDTHASPLARLTPRRGCGTAPLPGMPGPSAASSKAPSPKTAVPGATIPGIVPGIPDPRATDPKVIGPNGFSANAIVPRTDSAQGNVINGVAMSPASDAWAVGTYEDSGGKLRALTMHWDGAQWTATNGAWAAGVTDGAFGTEETLTAHWNGASWAVAATADPGLTSILTAVTATSTTSALAAGLSFTGVGLMTQHLSYSWNGTTWSPVPSP